MPGFLFVQLGVVYWTVGRTAGTGRGTFICGWGEATLMLAGAALASRG